LNHHTNEGEIFVYVIFQYVNNLFFNLFRKLQTRYCILFFHTATQSKNTRRDSKRYSFVMNYGHFAQEKLQQQLKFEENFLSMLQLFSF